MENTIIDELLNKIKVLEETNSNLKSKIIEVRSKLNVIAECQSNNEVNLEDEMIVEEEESNNILKENITNQTKILDNVQEHTITYIPYEQYNSLWIMGDFTGWEPKLMNKNNDIFSYAIVLLKGFKYYFSFTAKNEVLIDLYQEHENNPRSNQVNNFIEVKLSPDSTSTPFDYKLHSNLLQEARRNFTKAGMGNQKEVLLLENLVDFSTKYKNRSFSLVENRDLTLNKIRCFYDNKIDQIKNSETNNFENLCKIFQKRIVEKNDSLYYIDSINLTENVIKCMKLYDNNGIKVNLEYYIKKGFFVSFKFNELDKNFKVLSSEESKRILKDHESSNKVLKVVYKYESGDIIQTEGLVHFRSFGKRLLIVKLVPESLDNEQYDIDTSGNMINDVKNKKDNIKVVYTIEEIKDETENLPISLNIYYTPFKKTINVLHMHILNAKINLEKGFEIFNLDKYEDVDIYKNFSSDNKENSIIPRLRILFKNYKICKIFLLEDPNVNANADDNIIMDAESKTSNKVIELKAQEFNFKLDRIVTIQHEGHFKDYAAKIKKIPIYLLANTKAGDIPAVAEDYTLNYEKVDACQSNAHHDLSGYIDLQVIFDNEGKYLDDPINISLPTCLINFLPINKEMELENTVLFETNKRKSNEMVSLENIYFDVSENYQRFLTDKELLTNLSKEDILKHLLTLDQYTKALPKIGEYIEQKELWNHLEKICSVESMIRSVTIALKDQLGTFN